MNEFIPVNEPLLNGNEKDYLVECIDSGWISSEGPFVKRFETNFSEYIGRNYAVSVSNGTAAIDLAIAALDLKEGDEVIMPDFTIISCINQIIRAKIKPVLIDCDKYNFNMNVHDIESKITKNTKAIMVVHIYGLPVEMNEVLKIAKKYNLKIIEDAAEVHGQKYYDRNCGTFGDISTFSFYPNKHITTGEGGMVLTDDKDLYERLKSLRNLCFDNKDRFVHKELGWNMRLTNLQAALGVAQLEQIEFFIEKKRHIGNLYNDLLNDISCLYKPVKKTEYAENIYWVYGLVIKEEYEKNAKDVMNELAECGIGSRPFFYPMHKQPILKEMGYFKDDSHENSSYISKKGFYIPSGLGLSDEKISIVSKKLHEICRKLF